ncbi:MAG: gliding motility-associated C-terminal domain-containing protein [Prevotella sp.]|nr:gliding motility-associated C-terminal domain-containing protein [Prevotella sp.]
MQKYSHNKMNLRKILTLFVILSLSVSVYADITLEATYTDKEGKSVTTSGDITAEAPLYVKFASNPSSLDPGASIEWHIRNTTAGLNLTRYEQDIDFTFTMAGQNVVTLQVMQDNEVVQSASITITISESLLEMPNAFSPNGDDINDIYKAKKNYKSIVEFHAYIFNRYGQKLYEWTDITSGWDGTYHGRPVKDGTYYVYVKARGADGIEYNIRRDVNLLRDFNKVESGNEQR